MIEETGTRIFDRTEEIPVMEVSVSHGGERRRRDEDITTSGAGKRRRFDSGEKVFQLQYCSGGDVVDENVVSTAVSGTSDHVNSLFMCSINDDLISDLKAECVSETDDDGFSRETSTSSVVCLESEEMESLSTATKTTIEASSCRKRPPPAAVMMPSAAELDEFFSKTEKYEQKRFAEKYNFDIVKDVPLEGRYQWVPLKP